MFRRASGQFFGLTDERCARDVDVNVVLIVRIDDQRVRVRAAAGLHGGDLLRILDVGNVEDPHAAETIFLRTGGCGFLLSRRRRRIRRKPCVPQSSRPFGISTDMNSRFL